MSRPPEAADQVGAATLERMAAAPRYNRWMFDRLRPWVGRRVLEIGAGIGNMSAFLIDRERVVLTDTERYYLDRLRQRFAGRPHVSVAELRLPAVSPGLGAERLDTVVCLNVLEHIEDDRASLDRKSTRLNSSHGYISYAVFCLKKKNRGDRNQQPLVGEV